MSVTCTPSVDVDREFHVDVPITKAFVDRSTGKRYIVGVATGVAEDRDGERMSRNAIVGMVGQVAKGGVKLTTGHQQDWWSEIGDAVEAQHDAETDELIIKTELPPEGVDPLADKAWRTAQIAKVGFSVGGKLHNSFYERNELGKKRKVLDAIGLRHFALTKNPSYATSFAEAVAKTWDGDAPADNEFTLDLDDVEKDSSTGSWASGSSDSGGGNTGRDSVGSGQRNAGSRKPGTKGMSTEDDGSNEDETDEQDLPEAKDQERHLACPNCGHEFAADLPVDPEERQVDETEDNDDDEDDGRETGKSLEESNMTPLSETLDGLRALAAGETVAKTDPEPEVAKTPTEDGMSDVEKIVAAGHLAHEQRFQALEGQLGEAFETVAKAIKGLQDDVRSLPLGRKSIARTFAPGDKGVSQSTGHDDTSDVEKSAEQQVEEADTAVDGLKALNSQHPAYAQYS